MRTLLLLPCLLLGCESVPDVIAKHRSGVEKNFARIQALQPRLVAVEPRTAPTVKSAPLVLEQSGKAESNAMFIYAEDVPKPGEAKAVFLRTLDSAPLLQCGSLLGKQSYFGDAFTRPVPMY